MNRQFLESLQDLLEDEAVLDAIDEEKEFQAYVVWLSEDISLSSLSGKKWLTSWTFVHQDEELAVKESLEEEAEFDEDN